MDISPALAAIEKANGHTYTVNDWKASWSKWKREPASLTALDIALIETFDGLKYAKEAEAAREQSLHPSPVAPPLPPQSNHKRLEGPREEETFEAWCKRFEDVPAPMAVISVLFTALKQMKGHNDERNTKIAALEQQLVDVKAELADVKQQRPMAKDSVWQSSPVAALEGRITALDGIVRQTQHDAAEAREEAREASARIKSLEAEPRGLTYREFWDDKTAYKAGDVVSFAGSMWVCRRATIGERPNAATPTTDRAWCLSVKHGRDLRDRGRPAGSDAMDLRI